MTRVLLLGGTGDALALARQLGPAHIYSLAGLGRVPQDLACSVRVGGYGGAAGLAAFIVAERIGLVIDATHPYAAQMSRNAAAACATARVPCWAVRRAPWRRQAGDDWRDARDWADLERLIAPFERPLWTLGREPLAHLNEIPASQYWTVRCLDPQPPHTPDHARAAILDARGPFALDAERALFIERNIDVLISKNSGGAATEAKLAVARELGVPVVMLARPDLPAVDREFDDATAARVALAAWLDPAQLTE